MQEKKITTFVFDFFGVICASVIGGWYKDFDEFIQYLNENKLLVG
jgi:hypothetical protein